MPRLFITSILGISAAIAVGGCTNVHTEELEVGSAEQALRGPCTSSDQCEPGFYCTVDIDVCLRLTHCKPGEQACDDTCYGICVSDRSRTPQPPLPTGTATIGGRTFYDANLSDTFDAADHAYSLQVELYLDADADGLADGDAIAMVTPMSDGTYAFTDLAAGSYVVRFVPDQQPSRFFVTADIGSDDVDSDVINDQGFTGTITVAEGEQKLDVYAGIIIKEII